MKTWSTPVRAPEPEDLWETVPCTLCGGGDFVPHLSCEGFSYVKCRNCGLVQMNPQPGAGELRRRYGGSIVAGPGSMVRPGCRIAPSFGEEYLAYERANEAAFLRLQELSLQDAGFYDLEGELLEAARFRGGSPEVLDIGCATGALLAALKRRSWATVGVEISAPQAEYARMRRGLDIRTLPLEENRFASERFDAALASHLIEHLKDPASFAQELYRIVKRGGRIYVTTPNIEGFQARLFREKWRSAIFDHLYLFSALPLRALLEQKGFTVEKLITWGGLAAGIAPAPVKRA
ncbi:MAG: class I SAM-dependent methyltransferase, partial [Spirochaetaceae bacterium]|nr:class I SAM-dependent methyltransferase [Spirochaetaceae bacterium]